MNLFIFKNKNKTSNYLWFPFPVSVISGEFLTRTDPQIHVANDVTRRPIHEPR